MLSSLYIDIVLPHLFYHELVLSFVDMPLVQECSSAFCLDVFDALAGFVVVTFLSWMY